MRLEPVLAPLDTVSCSSDSHGIVKRAIKEEEGILGFHYSVCIDTGSWSKSYGTGEAVQGSLSSRAKGHARRN